MCKVNTVNLFGEEFASKEFNIYNQFKLRTDLEMLNYLKQFITVDEELTTPYKHKPGYYMKKGHYVNGKKVNRQVYKYIKNWLNSENN